MTLVKAVASSIAAIVVVLALAVTSNALLDRYFPGTSDPSASACIDASGQKRNWPWPNAPTLWPTCEDDPPPPAAKKEN